MAINSTSSALAQLRARNTRTAASSSSTPDVADRVQAKVWMNVGVDVGGEFIALPLGTAIDTMKPEEARGNNPEWLMKVAARNELLEMIQAKGDALEPGEEITLTLEVRLRRVEDKPEIDETSNPFSLKNAGFSL